MKNHMYKILSIALAVSLTVSVTGCHKVVSEDSAASVTTSSVTPDASLADTSEEETLPSSEEETKDSEVSEPSETLTEELTESEPFDPAFSIKEEEKDAYIQYGAYYYLVPDAPTDQTNRVGTLEKGTGIHMIGTVDMYDGIATTWRGKAESWAAFSLNGSTYFVPSEYVTENAPIVSTPSTEAGSEVETISSSEEETPTPEVPVETAPSKTPETTQTETPAPEVPVETHSKTPETTQTETPAPSKTENASASPYNPTGDPYSVITSTMASALSDQQRYYQNLSLRLAAGESATVNKGDMTELDNFFTYNFGIGSVEDHILSCTESEDGASYIVEACTPYSFSDRYQAIIQKYGAVIYPGDEDRTMKETYHRVHDSITYDLNYMNTGFATCMNDNRGVCWYIAQCFATLLSYEGIPAYTISGQARPGINHLWVRAWMHGRWVDLDPTADEGGSLVEGYNYKEMILAIPYE